MSGGQGRQVICVDGDAAAATRPVIDLGASQKEEKNGSPATLAQHHMGEAAQNGGVGPMHVDIVSTPTTPHGRSKREAGSSCDQSPAKQTRAASTSQDEPTNWQLM